MIESLAERRIQQTICEGYKAARLSGLDRGEPLPSVDFTLYGHALAKFRDIPEDVAAKKAEGLKIVYDSSKDRSVRSVIETTVISSCSDLLKINPSLQTVVVDR